MFLSQEYNLLFQKIHGQQLYAVEMDDEGSELLEVSEEAVR